MGQTYLMMFEPDKAIELYHQALLINPNDRMTKFNLFKVKRQMCLWDGWDSVHVPEMILSTINDLVVGTNTTMMPYDATLLPVSRKFILNVAISNLYTKKGLTPPSRDKTKIVQDSQLGVFYSSGGGGGHRKMPLNVAYYGYDFNNHPMGKLVDLFHPFILGIYFYFY